MIHKFLAPKPLFQRAYVFPFLIIYALFAAALIANIVGEMLKIVLMVLMIITNVVFFLTTFWSIDFKAWSDYQSAIPAKATHALVYKNAAKHGKIRKYIVPAIHENDHILIEYHKSKYQLVNGVFQKRKQLEECMMSSFLSKEGLSNEDVKRTLAVYGNNKIEIPIPKFTDLMKEHIVAPFFIFQIFCTGLWLMDEYWGFALTTLILLFVFESTVVKTRQMNMQKIKNMHVRNEFVSVNRNGKWLKINADEILLYDIVKIAKTSKDSKYIIPCDMVLIDGSCIVNEAILTGESFPLLKESIEGSPYLNQAINMKSIEHRKHLIFGGTELIESNSSDNSKWNCKAAVGVVVKSGYETTQGKVIKTVLYGAERVTVESKEAYFFILFLLFFAISAASYVFIKCFDDPSRSRWKLVLKCILIITSVVPPELPMELSLAVQNSIISLQTMSIFSTEPHRIPIAGKVNICCFDKTGTLTEDRVDVLGVGGLGNKMLLLKDLSKEAIDSWTVLGGCQSVLSIDKEMVGDPIEVAYMKSINWRVASINNYSNDKGDSISIRRKFAFNSIDKRMTVVANVDVNGVSQIKVLTKGAPETVKNLIIDLPATFDNDCKEYIKAGKRVLCLASKVITQEEAYNILREDFECKLKYNGLLIMESPLKKDTSKIINDLLKSSHKIVIISGDNAWTCCHVAKSIGIAAKQFVVCTLENNSFVWKDIDGKIQGTGLSYENIKIMANNFSLCMTGECIPKINKEDFKIFEITVVFARTTPNQKDYIIGILNQLGNITLMCGDGTNDVGSLKRANIGLAIINREETLKEKHERMTMKRRIRQGIEEGSTLTKIGDACIAAPFTYKFKSIKCVSNIIKQGRSTLVTTFQMYKILAIDCLLCAYGLSVLYLDGVKSGDFQSTIYGLFIGVNFFLVSRSAPLKALASERPMSSIFHSTLLLSVFGQFIIYFFGLLYVIRLAKPLVPIDESFKPDSDFKPNLINTVVYVNQCVVSAATFLINYEGKPFMQPLMENKSFRNFSCLYVVIMMIISFDFLPDLREYFQLVKFPTHSFALSMFCVLIGQVIAAYILERIIRKLSYRARN